jgi:hypothetical protein
MPNIDSIKVRMYRHGFGDCFLLQFFSGLSRESTMLIDCGLKYNDSVEGISLKDVVEDIKKTLKGDNDEGALAELDILVVTHEHWDHVSGFDPSEELFDDMIIHKVWMAWTEDPEDEEAKTINANIRKGVKALRISEEKMKISTKLLEIAGFFKTEFNGEQLFTYRQNFINGLSSINDFYGPFSASKTMKTSESGIKFKEKYKISIETQKAINHIRTLTKGQSAIQYFNPGDLIKNANKFPGIRIYVLGPPRNSLLNKDSPSRGAEKEVYFENSRRAMTGFINGVLRMGDAEAEYSDDGKPFDDVKVIPEEKANTIPYFKNTYNNADEAWRKIEDDWLDMAGALALQMDSDTNNTSLALGIEFIESNRVLLFPGDAQVGSWLSWHDLEWKIKKDDKITNVDAEQLLSNTVLYKASHHLSHNATLKNKGLELMTHEDLVALVPEKEKQYNGIPYKPLLKKLKEKTKGRMIISADKNYPAEKALDKKPVGLTVAEWKSFKDDVEINKLYVEYTAKG